MAVEHIPIIVQMRRKLVEDGEMEPQLKKTLQTIHKNGNSFGESRRKRAAWTKALPFKVKDARKEPVDVLWFVGDYASFDPRNQKVTQSFAALLQDAGVDFGILYEGESNSGNDVRRVGEEGLYEVLAESNIETLAALSFKSIVTTDPHSYNTIRNEYPDFGGNYEIQHYTTLLLKLMQEGKLPARPAARAAGSLSTIPVISDVSTRDTRRRAKSCACWAASWWRWGAAARIHSAVEPVADVSGCPIRSVRTSPPPTACVRPRPFPGCRFMW